MVENMKKFGGRLITAVVASSLIVTPVIAAPSVDELEQNKKEAQSEVNSLQSELTSVMNELSQIENDLINVGEEITKKEGELVVAEEEEQQQYEDMKLRIKYMYEAGGTSAFESLVASEEFSDFVNNAEYVQNVHSYDRQKLAEYVETKEKIETLKSDLEKDQKEIESKQAEYEEKGNNLDAMITSKSAEVADLDAQIQQAAAEAEAERQRREAEAAAAAAQNNPQRPTTPNPSNPGNGGGGGNTAPTVDPGSVVGRAQSQLGKPYQWGACGPNSFDCSGFVSYCLTGRFARLGTTLTFMGWPRVSNPQPGDVCTTTTHCGIYIGNGQMIHAPQTGDVVKVSPVRSNMIYVRY